MTMMDWSTQGGDAPASYEGFLVPAMFAPFANRLVVRAGVAAGSVVLDVACGTGVVSRAAARLAGTGGSLTGVDLGEPTLMIARAARAEPGAAPITYIQSDATSLPLEQNTFDVVLCQQGLQFFPDRPRALSEMRRVMTPGGTIAIATWTDIEHSPFNAVADTLAAHLGDEPAQMMRSPFGLSDAGELERLVTQAGFTEVSVIEEQIECTWASHTDFARRLIASGPVAQLFASATGKARRTVNDETAARLAEFATADGRLRMPMTTNIAVARA